MKLTTRLLKITENFSLKNMVPGIFEKKDYLIMGALFLFSVLFNYAIAAKSQYPNGGDGFVCAVQLKSLVEKGVLHYRDSSLIYPFLKALNYFCTDYITTVKLSLSLIAGFLSIAVYMTAYAVTRARFASVLSVVLLAASPTAGYFILQFQKNLLGMVFLLFGMFFFMRGRFIPSGVFFLSALVTHRLTAVLLLLFLGMNLFVSRPKLSIVLGIVAIPLLFAFSNIFPGVIHISDLERLDSLVSIFPQLPPYSFLQGIGFTTAGAFWIAEAHLLYIVIITAIILSVLQVIRSRQADIGIIVSVILLLLLFPFYKMDFTGAALRFYLAAVILGYAFALPLVLSKIKGRALLIVFLLSADILLVPKYFWYVPKVLDPPYAYYKKLSLEIKNYLKARECDIVVIHKPFAETFDYYTGMESLPWKPEERFDQVKVWRVAKDVSKSEIEYFAPYGGVSLTKNLSLSYTLVREDIWNKFRNNLSKEKNDNEDLWERANQDANPQRARPEYLMRSYR